ncbi:MAG: endo alpha-1,4 polygalactosaminidase [Chloroflexi bacterium]|nr:endo alpha-1,4 polygalactosaminidase [Chloroflexota bacterium]
MTKRLIFLILLMGLLGQGHVSTAQETSTRDWAAINDYIIQLQRARANQLDATAYDLVISDIALSGNHREVIEDLRNSEGGPKLVVAYMSIGQAAKFQYYWKPEWKNGNWPDWVGEADETWAGDVWVNYWDPTWQEIILTGPDAYIDQIIDLGFDGVLLDRVDAATYFREQGHATAYQEMADFVMAIASHARERSPNFGVFTINGEDIGLQFPDYLEAVTGILVEDLYYGYPRDHAASPPEWTAEREAMLDQWVAAHKIVLTVDYTLIPDQIDDAYTRSTARGYVPYCAERGLSRMLIHEGHEPD